MSAPAGLPCIFDLLRRLFLVSGGRRFGGWRRLRLHLRARCGMRHVLLCLRQMVLLSRWLTHGTRSLLRHPRLGMRLSGLRLWLRL
jgi:hypothetical protein